MKKASTQVLPKVTRGTFAEIARDLGVTRSAVFQRYRKGDPYIVNRVAKIEAKLLRKRRQAAKNLAKALGA